MPSKVKAADQVEVLKSELTALRKDVGQLQLQRRVLERALANGLIDIADTLDKLTDAVDFLVEERRAEKSAEAISRREVEQLIRGSRFRNGHNHVEN